MTVVVSQLPPAKSGLSSPGVFGMEAEAAAIVQLSAQPSVPPFSSPVRLVPRLVFCAAALGTKALFLSAPNFADGKVPDCCHF